MRTETAAGLALSVANGSLWTGLRHTGTSRTKITCVKAQGAGVLEVGILKERKLNLIQSEQGLSKQPAGHGPPLGSLIEELGSKAP